MTDEECWNKCLFLRWCAFLISYCCCSGGHFDTLAGPRSEYCCLQRVDALVQNGPTQKVVLLCDGSEFAHKYLAEWAAMVARSEDDLRSYICTEFGFVEPEFQGKNASAVGTLAEIKTLIDDSKGCVAAFVVPPGCMYFLRAGTWHLFINFALTFSLGHDMIVSAEAKKARVGFSTEDTALALDVILPYFIKQHKQGEGLRHVTDHDVREALLAIALERLTPEAKKSVTSKKSTKKHVKEALVSDLDTTPYRLTGSTSPSAAQIALPIGGETGQPLMNVWWLVEEKGTALRVVGWAAALLPVFGREFSRVRLLMTNDEFNVLSATLITPGVIPASLVKNGLAAGRLEDDWLSGLGTWLKAGWAVKE
jgi:hypothetical protein